MSSLWRCADGVCTRCAIAGMLIAGCGVAGDTDSCVSAGVWECRE